MSRATIKQMLKNTVYVFIALFGIQLCDGVASAQTVNNPPNWPWHGVSMQFSNNGSPEDIKRYHRELRINVVRLQVTARQYADKTGVSGEEALNAGLRWADLMLDTCANLGITAIINMSHFPLAPSKPRQTTAEFWKNTEDQKEVIKLAGKIASHFKRRGPELAAYDIMSEPVLVEGRSSLSPPLWPDMLKNIVAEIRKADSGRWIIVAPGPWGGPDGYARFNPPADKKLIWGAHVYLPHAFTTQPKFESSLSYPGRIRMKYWDKASLKAALEPLQRFSQSHPGPVFIGEFSAVRWAKGGETYLTDLVSIFNEFGWGWAYFSATGWHGWNPDYSSDYGNNEQSKQQLIGERSQRWQTLRTIFAKGNKHAPK
jgi:aryl-phospho-beta-D-glucosidase BglC (GH1 family)